MDGPEGDVFPSLQADASIADVRLHITHGSESAWPIPEPNLQRYQTKRLLASTSHLWASALGFHRARHDVGHITEQGLSQ